MQEYERMISMESRAKTYHRSGCPHSERIKGENQLIVLKKEARKMRYHPCRCCNSGSFLYKKMKTNMQRYTGAKQMEMMEINQSMYVKTEMGIWKIVYLTEIEKFVLYHGNRGSSSTPMKYVNKANYHRQRDLKETGSIMEVLKYIQAHDNYRKRVQEAGGDEMSVRVSKKHAKQRTNRLRRQSKRRIENLFDLIESQSPEFRKLSFC